MWSRNFLVTELLIIVCFIVVIFLGIIYAPYLKNSSIARNVASSIVSLEHNVYVFYTTYRALPGDISNPVKYWDIEDFVKECEYYTWDKNTNKPREIRIFKGFSGDGNGIITTSTTSRITTDSFVEATGAGCHLRLAKLISYKPRVLRELRKGSNGLWYSPIKNYSDFGLIVSEVPLKIINNVNNSSENLNQIQILSEIGNAKLSAYQAMLLDKKIDDGLPASGRMRCNSLSNSIVCCNSHVQGVCNPKSSYLRSKTSYATIITYDSKIIEKLK
ncbi:hypothetical protein CAXC1_280003 [Candidatus Xenohaliotis californiensis]|uniref:Prepilin-type N-terminal cleavage/methylation domain-containing protein n=1 Tax=Candidatus Xenohaliotis californiensis TaxID=84677 RepID=A0ABP0EXF4_9RICK|nr:hypothetical protein CAXC1_280003 [Candidatus Xenohaliotis californiensis]